MSLPESSTYRAAGLLGPSWIRAIWSPASVASAPLGGRDERLDMFRGLALVMIFINHVPGTVYEAFTNRNFGFSDAAEAFVFMSGVAAGLAYSNRFRTGNLWAATAKVWARARQLYFVHLTITFICLAVFAAFAKWLDLPDLLTKNNIAPLFQQPLSTIIGIPLLTHQLGYLNILPLYMTLLFLTPLIILAGLRAPWLTLIASIAVWAIGGQFRINFPAFPNPGGWFFDPFSWQLLFVLGLLSGMAMKVGKAFIPFNAALYALCAAFLVFVLLWMKIPPFGQALNRGLGWLGSIGVPFYITNFDKTFLSAPRLLHAVALFYVLGHLPIMRQVSASWVAAPLRLMGRQGLATFAIGTIFSILLQSIRAAITPNALIDAVLLGAGLLVLVLIAWALTRTAEVTRAKPPATP